MVTLHSSHAQSTAYCLQINLGEYVLQPWGLKIGATSYKLLSHSKLLNFSQFPQLKNEYASTYFTRYLGSLN